MWVGLKGKIRLKRPDQEKKGGKEREE